VKYLAEQRNEEVSLLKYSDFGIESYGFNILCHQRMLDENEGLVRRFLRATQRSIAWAVDHPDESASLMRTHVPGLPGAIALGIIRAIKDAAVRPETKQNGLGWMNPEVWSRLQDRLYEHDCILAKTPVDRLFTNQYLDRVVPEGSS
jgi:ABC-type nitrate/sulfonate/bicarbonate transport system substrate-binding protein